MAQECCNTDEKDNPKKAVVSQPENEDDHNNIAEDGHNHDATDEKDESGWKAHWDLLLALLILIVLLVLEYGFKMELPKIPSLIINGIAYLLAGRKVLDLAFRKSKRGDFFNEFVLMSVATIGAFIIGEYEEGVAVMVFYQIGEWFQDAAVNNAKRSIKALLDVSSHLVGNVEVVMVHPVVAAGDVGPRLAKPSPRPYIHGPG